MKSTTQLFFVLFVLVTLPMLAQQSFVPEWKILAKGEFVASHYYNTLAATDKQYLAVIGKNPDSKVGWEVGANFVRLSNDSGKTWREVRIFADSNGKEIPGNWVYRFYSSVVRPTKNLIMVLASERLKGDLSSDYYGTLYPFILRSTDEGKTWERIEIQTPAVTCDLNYLSMADEKIGYLISGIPAGTTTGYALLYKTLDGGKTWNSIQTPFSVNDILHLQALSGQELVIATEQAVYRTNDGGNTWATSVRLGDAYTFNFKSLSLGYCTGGAKNGIGDQYTTTAYKTVDGGATWTKLLDVLGSSTSIGDVVSFYDDNYGLVFARDNYWRTRDGGKTWDQFPRPYGSGYFFTPSKAIYILDTNRFFGLTGENMFFATGKYLLAPPSISFVQQDVLHYSVRWNSIEGAKRYHLQVAQSKPEFPVFSIDFDVFDTPKKVLDTILTATELTLFPFAYTMDYSARVMGLGDTLNSEWSQPAVMRTPDKPTLPQLDINMPIAPAKDEVLATKTVAFHWKTDARATSHRLRLTTKGNYPQAFDDAPENNIFLGAVDSAVLTLLPNTTYYWFVTSWAPGFDTTGGLSSTFKTGEASGVEEVELGEKLAISPQPVKDVLMLHGAHDAGGSVHIYSLAGILVADYRYTPQIYVHTLPTGMYIIRLGAWSAVFFKQ